MRKILVLSVVCVLAFAHDVWIQKDYDDGYKIAYGHGENLDPYSISKVKGIKAYDEKGGSIGVVDKNPVGTLHFKTEKNPIMIVTDFDNGFWSKASDGTMVNKHMDEVKGATESNNFKKFGKTLFGYNDSVKKPVGLELEVIPMSDPFDKDAKFLNIKVLVDGKPATGAVIKDSDDGVAFKVIYESDIVKIPLKDGVNTVSASFVKDSKDRGVNKVKMASMLVFMR